MKPKGIIRIESNYLNPNSNKGAAGFMPAVVFTLSSFAEATEDKALLRFYPLKPWCRRKATVGKALPKGVSRGDVISSIISTNNAPAGVRKSSYAKAMECERVTFPQTT